MYDGYKIILSFVSQILVVKYSSKGGFRGSQGARPWWPLEYLTPGAGAPGVLNGPISLDQLRLAEILKLIHQKVIRFDVILTQISHKR